MNFYKQNKQLEIAKHILFDLPDDKHHVKFRGVELDCFTHGELKKIVDLAYSMPHVFVDDYAKVTAKAKASDIIQHIREQQKALHKAQQDWAENAKIEPYVPITGPPTLPDWVTQPPPRETTKEDPWTELGQRVLDRKAAKEHREDQEVWARHFKHDETTKVKKLKVENIHNWKKGDTASFNGKTVRILEIGKYWDRVTTQNPEVSQWVPSHALKPVMFFYSTPANVTNPFYQWSKGGTVKFGTNPPVPLPNASSPEDFKLKNGGIMSVTGENILPSLAVEDFKVKSPWYGWSGHGPNSYYGWSDGKTFESSSTNPATECGKAVGTCSDTPKAKWKKGQRFILGHTRRGVVTCDQKDGDFLVFVKFDTQVNGGSAVPHDSLRPELNDQCLVDDRKPLKDGDRVQWFGHKATFVDKGLYGRAQVMFDTSPENVCSIVQYAELIKVDA